MDHAIQIRCLLVQFKECFVVQVIIARLLRGENHSDAVLEFFFRELLLQALQIEWIADELIVNLAKEFMSFQSTKPLDPTNLRVLIIWVIRESVNFILLLVTL